MITEDYCSFEVSKLLKEKGFDGVENHCHAGYFNKRLIDYTLFGFCDGEIILAPTQQMAMKWLREVYNIHIGTKPYNLQHPKPGKWYKTQTKATIYNTKDGSLLGDMLIKEEFREDTYEQALEAAINYVLKNLI